MSGYNESASSSEKKHLSIKECFNAKAWKKHWKTWVPKAILFIIIGFIVSSFLFVITFILLTQVGKSFLVGLDYVPEEFEGGDYFKNLEAYSSEPQVIQFFIDLKDTLFSELLLYIIPIVMVATSIMFGLAFLYLNLRNFHEKDKDNKGYDNRVWIRDSRKMVLTGDSMLVGKTLKTKFVWDNKKERPSGIVIGSVFIEDKDYKKLDKEQKMTPEVLESLKKQAQSENWKPLPRLDDWAKKYNREKKNITDGVKKEISRTDMISLKKQLKRDKFLAYDILNKKLLLKKKKLETLKQIELIKNANNKNLKVKKSK